MRVLLYGGTFDPPHEGHINLLRSAAQAVQPDRTILMPAGVPPHKAASATPAPLRLAMCRCFVQAWPGVQISDWEISRKGKSYTIDTVRMLGQRYPGARLYLCVGGDMLESFRNWRSWRELLARCVLVAHCREDADQLPFRQAARQLEQEGGKVLLLRARVVPQASTQLRRRILEGQSPWGLLPPATARVVERYRLYRPETIAQIHKE